VRPSELIRIEYVLKMEIIGGARTASLPKRAAKSDRDLRSPDRQISDVTAGSSARVGT
jgi:hypothetical protein